MSKKKASTRKKAASGRKKPHRELARIVGALQEVLSWQQQLVSAATDELKRLDGGSCGAGSDASR